MVYNCIKWIQDGLYPARCLLCGAEGADGFDLCQACRQELPHNHNACPRCALPLPAGAPATQRCGACRQHPPAFDRCLTPLLYQPPLDLLVGGLKFHGKLGYGRLLSRLMADYLERMLADGVPELIIPIPLHPTRLRSRGYNQALELARPLERRLGIPVTPFSCRRHKNTAPQVDQALEGRHSNISGAFQITGKIQARHVALVDDVVTTGSTVAELARTLKRAGVKRVDVWAAARTPSSTPSRSGAKRISDTG